MIMSIIKRAKRWHGKVRKKKLRELYHDIMKSKHTPEEIALGAAIGLFFSILPTWGAGMLFAVFIAWRLKLSMISTWIATLLVNPFNGSFVYYANYKIGSFILGTEPLDNIRINFETIKDIGIPLYLGGVILAAILAIICYFVVKLAVIEYRIVKEKIDENKKE